MAYRETLTLWAIYRELTVLSIRFEVDVHTGKVGGSVLYSPRNDPDPEMIPTFLLVDSEMIPKELGNGN